MPTAVPATVPPSRLCTKFVPPIVFVKEVRGICFFCYFYEAGTLPAETHPNSKKYRAERPPFFLLVVMFCLYVFFEFVCPGGHFGGHVSNFGCPDPHLDPKRAQGLPNTRFYRFPDEIPVPFGGLLGHLFGTFFFSSLLDTKKGGPGGPSKLDPFFSGFWGLPGWPQEGSRLDGSSIFTFAARPKKGSKMGAKMEPFGLPNQNYTHFGAPLGRNRGRKSCIEK